MYVRTWWLTLVLGAAGEACTPVRSAGLLQKAARHRSAGGVRAVNYGLPGCLCVGVDGVNRTKRQEPFIGAHCDNWTGPCKQEPCERWCFVDPCQCNVSSRESAATEQLTWEGRKLHLSEETCHSPPPTRGAKGTSPSDGRFCNAYDEESYGDRKCKCIGVEHLKGQVAVEVAGETATYPADVGSRCAAWDAEPLSLCAREDAPSWCQKSWCYVDPCACAIAEPPKVSTYFPSASYRKRPLYYSYETCGAQDSFTPDSSKACVNQETEARCLSLGADPEDPELRKCAWGGPEIKCLGKELLHMCQVDEETLSHWSWWSFSYGDVGSQQLLGAVDWDTAVSTVQHVGGCSLACVFLTDRASGLGCHAENPDTPGQCWCHALYGELPGSAYLMVVDMHDEVNGPLTEEELAFKKADALAMGLVLVIKEDQCDLEWETELAQALQKAEELCRQNGGRAPWGCMWFQEWLKNLNEAHERGQILHVFYFEGKVGCGKLPWEKLCDADAKDEARRNTGLGASQTAEVAYLEKLGLPYQEHDIRDFATFLRSHAR